MNAAELDELLRHAADHGEVVVYAPPDSWELVRMAEEPTPLPIFPGARFDRTKMRWEAM